LSLRVRLSVVVSSQATTPGRNASPNNASKDCAGAGNKRSGTFEQ